MLELLPLAKIWRSGSGASFTRTVSVLSTAMFGESLLRWGNETGTALEIEKDLVSFVFKC